MDTSSVELGIKAACAYFAVYLFVGVLVFGFSKSVTVSYINNLYRDDLEGTSYGRIAADHRNRAFSVLVIVASLLVVLLIWLMNGGTSIASILTAAVALIWITTVMYRHTFQYWAMREGMITSCWANAYGEYYHRFFFQLYMRTWWSRKWDKLVFAVLFSTVWSMWGIAARKSPAEPNDFGFAGSLAVLVMAAVCIGARRLLTSLRRPDLMVAQIALALASWRTWKQIDLTGESRFDLSRPARWRNDTHRLLFVAAHMIDRCTAKDRRVLPHDHIELVDAAAHLTADRIRQQAIQVRPSPLVLAEASLLATALVTARNPKDAANKILSRYTVSSAPSPSRRRRVSVALENVNNLVGHVSGIVKALLAVAIIAALLIWGQYDELFGFLKKIAGT